MAALTSLPALLESLTKSLSSASEMTPQLEALPKPKNGISLLDVKNELLLSYLQNLIFLIVLRIRAARDGAKETEDDLEDQVRDKLIELRLFLEKGARPLEGKLQYTISQFLKAHQSKDGKQKLKSTADLNNASASEDEEDDDDESEEEGSDEDEEEEEGGRSRRAKAPSRLGAKAAVEDITTKDRRERTEGGAGGSNGVYRPPMRERKLMDPDASSRRERRPQKSHTMDEYIATELSSAPMAEPSVGTTIVKGGRKMKSSTERAHEDERREYEENNFTRLPAESKKDRKKRNAAEGRSSKMQFGGEEWHGLGAGVDRIDRLTRDGGRGKGSGVRALLDKSRKRGPETTDGPRGDGMGDRFNKRVRTMGHGGGSSGGKKKSW